ncbi:MarR family winged helix-turn-helix transcriptional regulator [Neobacillus sp. GCM10023253]|uniref:MarR family winged helix-turn-helix transcriptional regulator n=1 Tax=Neobacillus sp. GCM10023253 TaxID=3252644 RepID=UPI00361A9A73
MDSYNNIFNLTHMIQQITNENIVRFTNEFSYPIGISTIVVLAKIEARGPLKQIDLTEALGYSKSTITNMAEKLVKLDLIERTYDKGDRRTVYLRITNKGIEARKEAEAIGEKIHTELFSILSEEELTNYIEIQKKLLANISDNKKLSF